ncbi:MAG: hypothetical protein PUK31_02375 [Candidatus Methanomethylophilaceae archaeon]|nr:hypothetical protein [Candidatus Methanomethylophilaceae archaeon]MDY5871999.1 hypothetical protein [Candidatus Methanomethylophilaceae archaeon]
MTEHGYELKIGAKYLIRSAEDEDTIGVFSGYAIIGSESALVIRMDGGKIRFFMVSQITYMDLLETSAEDERSKKRPEPFYG